MAVVEATAESVAVVVVAMAVLTAGATVLVRAVVAAAAKVSTEEQPVVVAEESTADHKYLGTGFAPRHHVSHRGSMGQDQRSNIVDRLQHQQGWCVLHPGN